MSEQQQQDNDQDIIFRTEFTFGDNGQFNMRVTQNNLLPAIQNINIQGQVEEPWQEISQYIQRVIQNASSFEEIPSLQHESNILFSTINQQINTNQISEESSLIDNLLGRTGSLLQSLQQMINTDVLPQSDGNQPATENQLMQVMNVAGDVMCQEESVCNICLDQYTNQQICCFIDTCGHFFHRDCLDKWLQMRDSCPVCRTTISNE